MTGCEGKLQ